MRKLILALIMALPLSAMAQGIIRHAPVTPQRRALKKSPFFRQKTENAYDL